MSHKYDSSVKSGSRTRQDRRADKPAPERGNMNVRLTWLPRQRGKWSCWWLIGAFLAVAAAVPAQAQNISITSGNKQTGVVATALANPLVVKVKGRTGGPVPGVTV